MIKPFAVCHCQRDKRALRNKINKPNLVIMRVRFLSFIIALAMSANFAVAQQTVTVEAKNYQVSDNLDLEAVAIAFGQAKNLEEFEKVLNDPENPMSNLDLNNDGYVDYLRVLEDAENDLRVIVVQAVLGKELFQDIATISVEGGNAKTAKVTVIGNSYVYGDNYVIQPVYVNPPVIFSSFWVPGYVYYRSLYYWDYYPSWYHHYHCLGYHAYHRHIHVYHSHHHHYCTFNRPAHHHHHSDYHNVHGRVGRDDFARQNPRPDNNGGLVGNGTRRPGNVSTSPNAYRAESGNGRPVAANGSNANSGERRIPTTVSVKDGKVVSRGGNTLPSRLAGNDRKVGTATTARQSGNSGVSTQNRLESRPVTTNRGNGSNVSSSTSTSTRKPTTVTRGISSSSGNRVSATTNRPSSSSSASKPTTVTRGSSSSSNRVSTSSSRPSSSTTNRKSSSVSSSSSRSGSSVSRPSSSSSSRSSATRSSSSSSSARMSSTRR